MHKNKKIIFIFTVLIIVSFVVFKYKNQTTLAPDKSLETKNSILDSSRVTKKTFGTYVSPKNSPVQPTEILKGGLSTPQETYPRERFTGYHTGLDFETTLEEVNIDVPVPALCDGPLILKKQSSGYGGVMVQACVLDGQAVTVIYGHIDLDSVTTNKKIPQKGDILAVLGKGYSSETDGERKHLHLSIHLGKDINLLGYVKTKAELVGWLHPIVFVK